MQNESMIYSFLDPVDFLNFEFRNRQRKDSKFTLRKWALQLGYQNPSYLSHILKRERKLKIDVAAKIADVFQLNAKEQSYFELIVLSSNSKTPVEKNLYGKLIRKIRPKHFWELDDFPVEKFEFASEWYNWAILEIFYLKDFFPNLDYIQARLGPSVTKKMVKDSITKLTELGFLVKDPDGTFRRGTDNPVFMKQIPSWAVQAYHKAMLVKVTESLDRFNVEERQTRGSMLALKKDQFEEARRIIDEAHKRIIELSAEDDDCDHVYHFSTYLFPVTENIEEAVQ